LADLDLADLGIRPPNSGCFRYGVAAVSDNFQRCGAIKALEDASPRLVDGLRQS
jgi:hypothetical protein